MVTTMQCKLVWPQQFNTNYGHNNAMPTDYGHKNSMQTKYGHNNAIQTNYGHNNAMQTTSMCKQCEQKRQAGNFQSMNHLVPKYKTT